MSRRPPISQRAAEKLSERERAAGLEPDDDAARWLADNDAPPPAPVPKAAHKNLALHRWRQQHPKR